MKKKLTKKVLAEENNVSAELLVKRILNLMNIEITCIEEHKESQLTELQTKMLPTYLRIILATKVIEKEDRKEEMASIELLTDQQLEALYENEKKK
jgi:hypothetical protein